MFLNNAKKIPPILKYLVCFFGFWQTTIHLYLNMYFSSYIYIIYICNKNTRRQPSISRYPMTSNPRRSCLLQAVALVDEAFGLQKGHRGSNPKVPISKSLSVVVFWSIFDIFKPRTLGKVFRIWWMFFSDGLKPPTSDVTRGPLQKLTLDCSPAAGSSRRTFIDAQVVEETIAKQH